MALRWLGTKGSRNGKKFGLQWMSTSQYPADWEKLARKELGNDLELKDVEWITPEGIRLKPLYTAQDVPPIAVPSSSSVGNGSDAPGIFPYKRGPYATMYTVKPWVRCLFPFHICITSNPILTTPYPHSTDDQTVCWLFHCRRIQQVLQEEPGSRATGALGGV